MDHDAVYLTPEGKAQAEQELDELIDESTGAGRAASISAIKQGDLSENADYQALAKSKHSPEGRHSPLSTRYCVAQLIDTDGASDDGRIRLGSADHGHRGGV